MCKGDKLVAAQRWLVGSTSASSVYLCSCMLVPSLEEELLEFVVQRVEQNVHVPNQKGLHFVIT